MKSWVKLYTEINRDPKILTLNWQQRGIWAALLAMAGEIDERDEEGVETGALDTLEYTALRIRCDLPEFQDAVSSFQERGMLEIDEGVLFLAHYTERQARAPSSRREAVASRVRKHRAIQAECNEDVTSVKRAVTPSDSDSDPDTERESDPETRAPAQPEADYRPNPDAIRIFRQETSAGISRTWRDRIESEVGTDAADLEFWKKVIVAWLGCGWKPSNVKGMLEFYGRRQLPGTNGNGTPSPPSDTGPPAPIVLGASFDQTPDWLGGPKRGQETH